jgi:initiation factor 1A
MVKNTTGGSGHKSQARKLVSSSKSGKVRTSENEHELYACVTKIFGNGICQVLTQHGKELSCHIRGKFRGRNKKSNLIAVTSVVLVGIREWENPVKNCDLLEVYDNEDVRILRNNPSVNLSSIDTFTQSRTAPFSNNSTDNVIFDDAVDVSQQFIPKPQPIESDIDFEDQIDLDEI